MQRCLALGIWPASPFPAGPLSPAMMCDGAWEKAEVWEVATEIEECGGDGTPRPPSRRSYYPAPSPPARLVPRPKFSLSQAGTETLTTSTPPPRTSQRASRVRSQSPIRRVARHRPTWTREWTTSRYSTRLRKECLTSWWTLLYQVWQISFENEVVTRSRELSVLYRDCGRRYPRGKTGSRKACP